MIITAFVYPLTSQWTFGVFPFLAIVNKMLLSTFLFKFFMQTQVYSSLEYMYWSEIAGTYGNSV